MLPQHSKVLNNYRLLVFFIDWFLRFFLEKIEYDEVREVAPPPPQSGEKTKKTLYSEKA